MDILPNQPVRILSNGAEITDENIIDNQDEIRFEFELANTDFQQFMSVKMLPDRPILGIQNIPKAVLEYTSDLFTPDSGQDVIIRKLQDKGWVDDVGNIIISFKWSMDFDPHKKKISLLTQNQRVCITLEQIF